MKSSTKNQTTCESYAETLLRVLPTPRDALIMANITKSYLSNPREIDEIDAQIELIRAKLPTSDAESVGTVEATDSEAKRAHMREEFSVEAEMAVLNANLKACEMEGRALSARYEALKAGHDAIMAERNAVSAKNRALEMSQEAFEVEGRAISAKEEALDASRKFLDINRKELRQRLDALKASRVKEGTVASEKNIQPIQNAVPDRQSFSPLFKKAAALHYATGEEVQPGDEVECDDGFKGKIHFIMVSGPEKHPDLYFSGLNVFSVERSDGSYAEYQTADTRVKLLSRKERMSSPTMDASIQKAKFLELLKDLGSHSLCYPAPLSKQLTDCGLSATVATDGQGLLVEGQLISVSTPEWGEPGISPLSILSTVYELATGGPPHSNMTGRGFWFDHVISMLATHWGLKEKG